jgi:branched-chain amino acid transport system permease protein
MTKLARHLGPWVMLAAFMVILPRTFASSFSLTVLSQIGVFIIFSCAYNMLLGQGGMLSFGHAIYFGMAGYFTIHLINYFHTHANLAVPLVFVPCLGGLAGLVLGVLIGYVSTQRGGTTFAMISLGFGEMATALTLVLLSFFNGYDGVHTDRVYSPQIFSLSFGSQIQIYYLIAAWCFIATAAMFALTLTPFGQVSHAVRDNPERAEFTGYNPLRVRWLAFSLSSFFAGLAGSLHAINYEQAGPATIGAQTSALVLFMTYIGGIGSFLGPIVGATLLGALNANLASYTNAWGFYLGLVFILTVIFAPDGLAGLITMHKPLLTAGSRLLWRLVPSYVAALGATILICSGMIGVVEMIYHLNSDLTKESVLTLFRLTIDAHSWIPWAACTCAVAVGVLLSLPTYRWVGATWHATLDEARRRAAG